jgi:hypothetical protein
LGGRGGVGVMDKRTLRGREHMLRGLTAEWQWLRGSSWYRWKERIKAVRMVVVTMCGWQWFDCSGAGEKGVSA